MSADEPARDPGVDWSWPSLGLGLVSAAWAITIVVPGAPDLPAWPAASVGVFALLAARLPGRAWPRGLGAFLGFVGIVIGLAKIAALWGFLDLFG
ncbi:hypothetical protein ACNOYE_36145 [Nannocystaceae bacterium ST9]